MAPGRRQRRCQGGQQKKRTSLTAVSSRRPLGSSILICKTHLPLGHSSLQFPKSPQTRPFQLRAIRAAETRVICSHAVPRGHGCLREKGGSHDEVAFGTPHGLAPCAPPTRERETHWLCGRPLPSSLPTQPVGLPARRYTTPMGWV